jgi:hypothetical protein
MMQCIIFVSVSGAAPRASLRRVGIQIRFPSMLYDYAAHRMRIWSFFSLRHRFRLVRHRR